MRAALLIIAAAGVMLVAALCAPALAEPAEPRRWSGPLADRMYECNRGSAAWTRRELECVVEVRFAPLGEAENAKRIVACESRWNPRAVSRTNDHGLFQINRPSHPTLWKAGESMYDPVWNTLGAARLVERGGWGAWVCARIVGVE